ncbi:replication-relaxation family protein (plasmid) [Streptomyces sp. FXJ1.172]|uniref:replication-relaxation family protein n=1 Tax=Streptomyces sp. FXJ1.172 TaxID=710705 RepID=UPI002F3FA394
MRTARPRASCRGRPPPRQAVRPLDWIPEVHHPLGNGEAVIPDALLYYRRGPADGDNGSMLRAFVEVDRATMDPERLAAKLTSYEREVTGDRRPR